MGALSRGSNNHAASPGHEIPPDVVDLSNMDAQGYDMTPIHTDTAVCTVDQRKCLM